MPRASILSHPLMLIFVSFLLTGILGSSLTYFHEGLQKASQLQHDDRIRARDAVIASMNQHRERITELSRVAGTFNVSAELYVRGVIDGSGKEVSATLKSRYDDSYVKLVAVQSTSSGEFSGLFYYDQAPYVENGKILGIEELAGFSIPFHDPVVPGAPARASVPPSNLPADAMSLSLQVLKNLRNWSIATAQIHACISNQFFSPQRKSRLDKGFQTPCLISRNSLSFKSLLDSEAYCIARLSDAVWPHPADDFLRGEDKARRALRILQVGDPCSEEKLGLGDDVLKEMRNIDTRY